MAATQLILDHRYANNMAYDWSGNGNHGYLVDVNTAGSSGGLVFGGPDDERVTVRNSTSLSDFGELRLRVRFTPRGVDPPRRYNLVEGHLAFALFTNPDGSVEGTINSPSGGWIGTKSGPGRIVVGREYVVDFLHDGISQARLYLDGSLVGHAFNVNGPIGNLGPKGLYIGHWPEDDRYTYRGLLFEVQVWKYDPKRDAKRVIDDCCVDRKWVDDQTRDARARGWHAPQAHESIAQLFAAARGAAAEVRGGDAGRTAQLRAITNQAVGALASGDQTGLIAALGSLNTVVIGQLGSTRATQLGNELYGLLCATPLGDVIPKAPDDALDYMESITHKVCLGDSLPPRPKGRHPDREHPPEKLPPSSDQGDSRSDLPEPPLPELAHEEVEVPPGVDPNAPPGGSDPSAPPPAPASDKTTTGDQHDLA